MRALVIGESCKDEFVYGNCTRLCPEAPAPVFNPMFKTDNGGMAKNVQKNVLSLGAECDIFTNVNWEDITKTRYIDHNFNHMFIRIDANDGRFSQAGGLEEIDYSQYCVVIISDYNKGFLSPSQIGYIATRHDNVFLDTKKILDEKWCKNVKFIKINNDEYKKTEHTITREIEEKLIVTLSSKGCRHKEKTYPVKKVEIKDSSGAGDTFIAAFATKFVDTNDVDLSIEFANECSTRVVQKRGVVAAGR